MPQKRRVVTGVDSAGRSVVVSDGPAPRTHDFTHIPAMRTTLMWATVHDDGRAYTGADPTPVLTRDLPAPGETRFLLVSFPPDAVYADPGFDPAAAQEETRRVSPDLAARFEPGSPGMHATDTLDYMVVLDGDIHLELDDGVIVRLTTGDVVVQCANRHAWRNPGPTPVTLAVVQLGPLPLPARGTPHDARPAPRRSRMTARITRAKSAPAYFPPRHEGVAAYRLQGHEAGPTERFWVGLSFYEPGGRATVSPAGQETVYVVLDGELTFETDGRTTVLRRHDSVHLTPGTVRSVENRGDQPATLLVTIAVPAD